ncbi:integrin alpha-11-like isoform X2 [Hippocampus zosterae]|uniref:integrin alpha-11-like isoform X2 n=1 Tax=Hippocampus zosterae TaxID=109293 RepID=UPI00223DBA1A|nr:integrin alpha-11-like isoform X2 [Hippocampus zosterae]
MDSWRRFFIGSMICGLLPGTCVCFNLDAKRAQIFRGWEESHFGYTLRQHKAQGRRWLLVGAPQAWTDDQQTGDVFRCPVDAVLNSGGACSRLHLGNVSVDNVMAQRKDGMRLGMTLTTDRKDGSFVTCGPLWSHECGSSVYTSGVCAHVGEHFQILETVIPAFQSKSVRVGLHGASVGSAHPRARVDPSDVGAGCETFVDLLMVVDGSNSIYPWSDVTDFLVNILRKVNIGPGQTQVGVVQYGSRVAHEFRLGEHRTVDEVLRAVADIRQRGGEETRTALAINTARSRGFKRGGRAGAHKVLVVITDGESHDNAQLDDAVARCKSDNITMYAIAVLGYYNRRGIDPSSFLKEIRFIASDPDEDHFFNVTDEAALKDIVDALGERIFSLEGSDGLGRGFGLQMAQAGFSSHLLQDGLLLGAVGAYDWNGAVLKRNPHGNLLPDPSAYGDQFPEELRNHAAYFGYSLGSLLGSGGSEVVLAGAPRFNHSGKVVSFTLDRRGNVEVLQALVGEQMGSYFGSVLLSMDVDGDGLSDLLLVAAPMYCSQDAHETGKVYLYKVNAQSQALLVPQGALLPSPALNSRFGAALVQIPDVNADGFNDLAVGAPLEDGHRGALYLYHGHQRSIRLRHTQRLCAAAFDTGLKYFGQSLDAAKDDDGDVSVAVGALGAAVIVRSRRVVRLESTLTFEPEKVNVFHKDCWRGGKAVTCMAATVCLRLHDVAGVRATAGQHVAHYHLNLDEKRVPHRAVLDEREGLQTKTMTLATGRPQCRRHAFTVQDTMDYNRPITVGLEAGLRSSDDGPILDPDWPSTLKAELPFWNGCRDEDACVPDLVIESHTDLINFQHWCASPEGLQRRACRQQGAPEDSWLVETTRRRVALSARLENRGENAYRSSVLLSSSPNLLFAGLVVMDQSDAQMECFPQETNRTRCNVSAPLMKASSRVFFRVEFEFSSSVFLDHLHIAVAATSEGRDAFPEDNHNDMTLPLKYETDLLFTTDQSPARFVIQSEGEEDDASPAFNVSFYLENLSWFSVEGVAFWAQFWAVSLHGNHLLTLTHCGLDQDHDMDRDKDQPAASCVLTRPVMPFHAIAEDLTHLTQMNQSNSASMSARCSVRLPASRQVKLTLRGRLQRPVLRKVVFKTLKVLVSAHVHLDSSSSFFLREEHPVRQTAVELMKARASGAILVAVILASSAGGFLALAVIVLALWRLGFFSRKRRSQEPKEPATNGKPAEGL